MPDRQRSVFFVSDRTGITAEALGNSLLTQFDGFEFRKTTIPFVAPAALHALIVAMARSAASAESTNGIVVLRNSKPSNCVSNEFPRASAVIPVRSETKNTLR